MKKILHLLLAGIFIATTGCSGGFHTVDTDSLAPLPGSPIEDNVVIKGRAEILILPNSQENDTKFIYKLLKMALPKANAYSGSQPPSSSITVSYTIAASAVGFTLSTTNTATIVGDILTLGTFQVSGLDDNKLKMCPASGQANNGNVKCANAAIRVKLTDLNDAPISGFPSPDNEGNLPVTISNQAGTDTAVGSTTTNIHTRTTTGINRLRQTHFAPTQPYTIKADLTNAGAGVFGMKIVVEYVLYN